MPGDSPERTTMATPIDSALIAAQTYKARKPAADARQRAPAHEPQDRAPAAPVSGRRGQPAVAFSLSAEALQVLSGNREPARHIKQRADEDQTPKPAEAEAAASTDAAFEPLGVSESELGSSRREAPFAHMTSASPQRLQLPGSRLDIKI